MKTKAAPVDIRLERDPRYSAAIARLAELKAELNTLERQRGDVHTGISSLGECVRNQITQEAEALLSVTPVLDVASMKKAELFKTLDELTHRLDVVKTAATMQQNIVNKLRGEVGEAIALDVLPQHRANVCAVFEALLQLNTALEAEADLREALSDNNVPFTSVITAMPLRGFSTLRDNQGRVMRYLLECYEHGFVAASDLPDVVRDEIPPLVKRTPPHAKPVSNPKNRLDDNWT